MTATLASVDQGRPQARDTIAAALDRYALAAPRPPSSRRAGTWPTDAATSIMGALQSAGFLVVHLDAMPADLRAAVAPLRDGP